MKKYFNVGQSVYSATHGAGAVFKIDEVTGDVTVRFVGYYAVYNYDGSLDDSGVIHLSQNPIAKIINKPIE